MSDQSLIVQPSSAANIPAVTSAVLSPEERRLIKNMVAKNCTDEEFTVLLRTAEKFQLDPLPPAREIWCIKRNAGDPALIMVGRDGLLKAAKRDPHFQGLSSFVVREGDHFQVDAASGTVEHRFGAKRGHIIGAWAMAHAKGRMPSTVFADFSEYKGNSPPWQKFPSAMIQKCAEVLALRRQFGLSGLLTHEEMDVQIEDAPEPSNKYGVPLRLFPELQEEAEKLGLKPDDLKRLRDDNGLPASGDMTAEDFASFQALIRGQAQAHHEDATDAEWSAVVEAPNDSLLPLIDDAPVVIAEAATAKQIGLIKGLQKKANMTREALVESVVTNWGCALEELTKTQASEVIEFLNGMAAAAEEHPQ